jgi:transcriptional regulator with XRE-family HTH domain
MSIGSGHAVLQRAEPARAALRPPVQRRGKQQLPGQAGVGDADQGLAAPCGTRVAYRRGCRCPACRAAERDYARQVARLKAYGRWQPFTDAAPVRAHVRHLMGYGIGAIRIAALAGVSGSTVVHLLYGDPARGEPPGRRIRPAAAERLLAIHPVPQNLAATAAVDATGTRRRLQALTAGGWSGRTLAARLPMEPAHLNRILRGRPTVAAATAGRVRQLYNQLWDQPPPEHGRGQRISAAKARSHATRQHWPPPLAWDDDTIDDPAAQPHPWRAARRRSSAALAADAAELATDGYTRAQAAARLGVSRNTLDQAIRRMSRPGRAA